MSILRHFNKHQGWHNGKRTYNGGGNPISAVTDSISHGLGTDGSGGGLNLQAALNAVNNTFTGIGSSLGESLASIDPGPSIGKGLSEVDTFVNREIPGGWVLPAAVAAAFATGYIDPSLFATEAAATEAAGAGAGAISTEAGQTAFFNALANGATSTEAVSAGLAADAVVAGGVGAMTTDQILASSGFTPAEGSSFVVNPDIAYTTGAANLGLGTNAPLQGPTYQELGVTGVPEGGMGPTYGELGYTGLNNAEAIAAADAAAKTGLSASDVLSNANRLKNIAKLLTGSESSPIFSKNTPTAQQWAQQAAQNFAQYTPEQFGGYYQMNKNPFTFQNPLANALKSGTSGLDVSGTGGQSLNTQGQATNLAKLLA